MLLPNQPLTLAKAFFALVIKLITLRSLSKRSLRSPSCGWWGHQPRRIAVAGVSPATFGTI